MSHSERIGNAIVTFADTDFNCPKCSCPHKEKDYYTRLYNSKTGVIYKSCKECKTKLGISSNIKGDVVVWLKEDEKKP